MKLIALLIITVLLLAPAVIAVHEGNEARSSRTRREFRGLQGIIGVSVEESERPLGPQKPFGRPLPKRLKGHAPLPPRYRGLAGIAGEGIGTSKGLCDELGCTPSQTVVGDKSTRMSYRCRCPAARSIAQNNIQCIDTPGIAEKIGYTAGPC